MHDHAVRRVGLIFVDRKIEYLDLGLMLLHVPNVAPCVQAIDVVAQAAIRVSHGCLELGSSLNLASLDDLCAA